MKGYCKKVLSYIYIYIYIYIYTCIVSEKKKEKEKNIAKWHVLNASSKPICFDMLQDKILWISSF